MGPDRLVEQGRNIEVSQPEITPPTERGSMKIFAIGVGGVCVGMVVGGLALGIPAAELLLTPNYTYGEIFNKGDYLELGRRALGGFALGVGVVLGMQPGLFFISRNLQVQG